MGFDNCLHFWRLKGEAGEPEHIKKIKRIEQASPNNFREILAPNIILSESGKGKINIVEIEERKIMKSIETKAEEGFPSLHIDQNYIFVGLRNGNLLIFELETGKLVFNFNQFNGGHAEEIRSIFFLDGSVFTGSLDKSLRSFSLQDIKNDQLLNYKSFLGHKYSGIYHLLIIY